MSFRQNPLLGFTLICLLVGFVAVPAGAGSEPADGPLVVKIHADWCGTCVRLNPVWDQLQAGYGESARFVVLDVTDKDATDASSVVAASLGITAFFDANKGRTGTIAILDPKTGEPVSVFKGETDPEAYQDPLSALLKAS